ncbi:MAG: bifunctional hydroxymethylpyrimidine kinase/phosphomethylpyrimidine kinase, partial [Collinsella sp.]
DPRGTLMKNTQLLLINDMCGYGKVALSAMLPVLSHMGYRIHNLPTALVSDTLNYPKFYIHDTTEYVRQSLAIWEELGFEFDAISTGFIVTEEETRIISDFCHRRAQKGTKVFVDPIMGDNGKLYAGVPESTIGLMRSLLECADYAVPNYTEACLLTDTLIAEQITPDEAAPCGCRACPGAKSVVITSAVVDGANVVIGYDHVAGEHFTIPFELIPVYFPGTGDTFSAVLVGRVMAGWSLQRATSDAMRVVAELIERNAGQEDKSAGLPIEACLDVIDHE